MDNPGVVQPLHDLHVLPLRTRRAHACVNSACAALARAHFALPRLYVTRDDCEHANAHFVLRKLLASNPGLLLCAKGEPAYPMLRLDAEFWRRRNEVIVLDNIEYTAAYFLGRALASTSNARFQAAHVVINADDVRRLCSVVDAQVRANKQIGLHAVLSAIHEHQALSVMATSAMRHFTGLNLSDMHMDSATVQAVGSKMIDQDRQSLFRLNLSKTTAWVHEDAVGTIPAALAQEIRYEKSFCNHVLAKTEHTFAALTELNVSSNPLGKSGASALTAAMMCNRFPELGVLKIADALLDAGAIGVIAPAFCKLRNQLDTLDLSHNHFEYIGLCTLMACTTGAKNLARVNISDINCPDWAYERLGDCLKEGQLWPAIDTLTIKSTHARAPSARTQHTIDLAMRKSKACRDWQEFNDSCASKGVPIGQPPN